MMRKLLLSLFLLLMGAPALAATYYVSDCQTGALNAGRCAAGSDANSNAQAQNPATPKQTPTAFATLFNSTVACGDTILLARGGAWANGNVSLQKLGCTPANPIIVDAYTPTGLGLIAPVTGTTTSIQTTGITDSAQSFPTAGTGLTGYLLETKDINGATVFFTISSNTATAITVTGGWLIGQQPNVNVSYTMSPPQPIWVEARASTNAFDFIAGGSDGGYVFRNIDVRGNGTGLFGFFLSGAVHDVKMEKNRISGFDIGIYCGTSNQRFQAKYNTISGNRSQGFLSGCDDVLLQQNTLYNNGFGAASNGLHNVYSSNDLQTDPTGAHNLLFTGNSLYQNSRQAGQCQSSSMVIHGTIVGIQVSRNYVYEEPSAIASACFGIQIIAGRYTDPSPEGFFGVLIDGNILINVGNAAIDCSECVDPIIQNNIWGLEAGTTMPEYFGFSAPGHSLGADDTQTTGAKLINNTCFILAGPANASCFSFAEGNGQNAGSNLVMVANVAYIGSAVNANHSIYRLGTRVLSNFTNFRRNIGYHQAGNGRWSETTATASFANLAAAQGSLYDLSGSANDPLFVAMPSQVNGWACALQGGSPGTGLGDPTWTPPYDNRGKPRGGTPNAGACQ